MDFTVKRVEDVDGRIYVEWETVADDGLPLVEGDYFDIEPSESAVAEALERVKAKRAEINSRPKPQPRETTRKPILDVGRVNARLRN